MFLLGVVIMVKAQENIIDYMVVCVNEFAEKYSIDYKQAFNYLSKYKAINFLIENYEIEHTLSIDNAIDDLEIIANNNGGHLF